MDSYLIWGGAAAALAVFVYLWPSLYAAKRYSFAGKRVVISGASQGMGRATAIELAKKGAHVFLLARGEKALQEAVEAAKKVSPNSNQKIAYFVCDVTKKDQIVSVMKKIQDDYGCPDCVIPCAGLSIPKLFLDATLEDFENQMQLNYFGSLYMAHEGARQMKESGVSGKIVLVTSTMSLTAFIGYSPYAPTKAALRSLGDCLRNEFQLYGIGVHVVHPTSMDTPGFEEENRIKPELTKKIEGTSDVLKPEQMADVLVKGVEKGDFHISGDLGTEALRILGAGTSIRKNVFFEIMLLPLLAFLLNIAVHYLDYEVAKTKGKEQEKDKKKQ